MLIILLIAVFLVGLLFIPLGLPGLWVMVLGLIGYGALTDFRAIGVGVMGSVLGLAFVGEIIEWWVGFRLAKRYGGSRRAAWGALIGGLIGAVIGVPIPILGSVIGSFAGSFGGAMLAAYSESSDSAAALGAGWGAVLGRAWAAAAKTALGIVIVVIGIFAALRG
jgi:uncharacterized protein YqgC (DUF456 family)